MLTTDFHNHNTDTLEDMLAMIANESVDTLDTKEAPLLTREEAEQYIRWYKSLVNKNLEIDNHADGYLASMKEKIESWRTAEKEKNADTMAYIESRLEAFAKANITGKSKSLKLIEGTLSFRKEQPSFEYDEEILRPLITEQFPMYLEAVKPKIKYGEFKKAGTVIDGKFYMNDKLIEGVTVTPKPESFKVK